MSCFPQILLLGNGLNRAFGGEDWSELLENMHVDPKISINKAKSIPFPLQAVLLTGDQIDITFYADGLSDRKEWLIGESDIMVVLPGSVGTLDEAFTAMASHTFGEHQKRIVFYNINGFWDDLFMMLDNLEQKGVVNKPFGRFVARASNLEELVSMIE